MKLHTLFPLTALLFAGQALAGATTTFPIDAFNSKGQFENIRNLAVDPATAAKALVPAVSAAGDANARLVMRNTTTSAVGLYVAGTRIGDIEPLDTVTLSGLKPGVYDVIMALPNGYRTAYRWSTDPAVAPVAVVPAPPQPTPPAN